MYLVDTNVISALAPSHSQPTPSRVSQILGSPSLYLSSVTIAEIEGGVAKCRRTGAARKAAALTDWLESLLHLYAQRILPVGVGVARAAGALNDLAIASGHTASFADVLIAATAQHHGLTMVTSNPKHFSPFGVAIIDPYAETEESE